MAMNSALANLPGTQRKVLELAYFDGDPNRDCQSAGGAFRTVKTRMRSGIQRLRDMLGTQAV
jgi:DNA-directed RNA polymerase specialized sigma24 family protein